MLAHRLALRELLRHRRRSLLTSLVIVITMALLTCFQGLSDGGHRAMIDIGIRLGLGHLVVSATGHSRDPGLDRLVSEGTQAVAQIREQAGRGVSMVVPRVRLSGLVQAGPQQVAVVISGVVPADEERVSVIASSESIVEGNTLSRVSARFPGDLPPMVVGARLARTLGVRVDDRVTVTAKPRHLNGFSRAAFRVAGIFETGMQELDGFWIEVPLESARSLANVGDDVSQIAVYLDDQADLAAIRQRLLPMADRQGWDVQRWNEAAPELHSAVALDAAGMRLLMVIVIVVVVAGILNTVILSSLGRRRQFGVLLAIGGPPRLIARAIVLEATYLSAASVVAGVLLGYGIHRHFASVGLDFREVFGTGLEAGGVLLPDRFYSWLDPGLLAAVGVLVLILTILASLYPAWRSSRVDPMEAIRHHA